MTPTPHYDSLSPEQQETIEQIIETGIVTLRESLASILFATEGIVTVIQFQIASNNDGGGSVALHCFLAWEPVALILAGAGEGAHKSIQFMNDLSAKTSIEGKVR